MKTLVISLGAILLIGGGSFTAIKLMKTFAPEAEKKERVERALVVETETVREGDVEFVLESEGVVRTRRDTILSAEVAGKIVEVDPNFEVGARFAEGAFIARIDQVDYEAAVAQAASVLAEAELALVQEENRADQAARDWRKIGGGKEPSDLVLRKPFLESARARVKAAEEGLRQARTNLERTVIQAPFDCRVRAVNLNLGATVMAGAQLGTIYDADNLLIQLPLTLDDYARLPQEAGVELHATISGVNYEWQGELLWDLGEVDRETFSASVLVKVRPNPEAPERFRLPLPGTFLKARLKGAVLPGVVEVPRAAVRGRDEIFVLGEEDTLEIRRLQIVRRTSDMVYATDGIEDGEKVILTKIEMPVPGMALQEAARAKEDEPPAVE